MKNCPEYCCLNSGCNVSPAVRQEIEETLLLPIANI
ncbi:NACHT C-terminal helical domain 2-containing protein [Microcoleus sp. herbarium5]